MLSGATTSRLFPVFIKTVSTQQILVLWFLLDPKLRAYWRQSTNHAQKCKAWKCHGQQALGQFQISPDQQGDLAATAIG